LAGSASADLSTEEILKKADEARGNLKGVQWEVSVVSKEKERTTEMVFFVQARGFDVLATSLFPAKDKGNKILLVSGNMWFHRPGLSKPVPISQRQKLVGMASMETSLPPIMPPIMKRPTSEMKTSPTNRAMYTISKAGATR